MSLYGSLEDVSLLDILQILHITQKTGTLLLEKGKKVGKIYLKEGNIIGTVSPDPEDNIGCALVKSGLCSEEDITEAVASQKQLAEPKPLGAILVENKKVGFEQLKDVVLGQIVRVFQDLASWEEGSFFFDIDSIDTFDEISYIPHEMVPAINIDTRVLLLESVKILDEKNRSLQKQPQDEVPTQTEKGADESATDTQEASSDTVAGGGSSALPSELADIDDKEIYILEESVLPQKEDVAILLLYDGLLIQNIKNHWGSKPFKAHIFGDIRSVQLKIDELLKEHREPVIVTDVVASGIRGTKPEGGLALLRTMKTKYPRLDVILTGPSIDYGLQKRIYAAGAHSILVRPARQVVAETPYVAQVRNFAEILSQHLCNYFEARTSHLQANVVGVLSSTIQSLKESLQNLQRNQETSTVSLLLLEYISKKVDRAILFFVREQDLIGLGAFGNTLTDQPLAARIANLRVLLQGKASTLKNSIVSGQAFSGVPDKPTLKSLAPLHNIIGRPVTSELLLVPIVIQDKTSAIVYGDNGKKQKSILDIAIVDILVSHASIVLENAMLHKRLGQLQSGPGVGAQH